VLQDAFAFEIPAWYSPPVAEWIVVAPEYGNFAKLLKIEPIYDSGASAEATAGGP
jgi:hypothetical protein